MKTIRLLSPGIFFVFTLHLAIISQAAGDDYLAGKWKVSADSPNGVSIFTVQLNRVEGKLTGDILRDGESTAIQFSKIDEKEDEVILYFLSSSGYDVDFRLKKVDDNNMSGTAMGTYGLKAERFE